MLKRQRSTSFAPDAYTHSSPEPSIDMYERVTKRRRQFAPPRSQSTNKGKSTWRGGDSDGEEDLEVDEQTTDRLAPSGQAQGLEHAGEYKHVNSLLHDLHAEQRHRILFSSPLPPSHFPLVHHAQAHSDLVYPFPSLPDKMTSPSPVYDPPSVAPPESQRHMPTFTISIQTKDASVVDHLEVRHVTERYEDTNRFLGALFLSRRRQHDVREHQIEG